MNLVLYTAAPFFMPLDARELTASLDDMLCRAGCGTCFVELECTHDADLRELNAAYMGCHGPTNILSFPSGERPFLGSLAVSVECLAREARLYGQPPQAYCRRLLAHGLAHLLGHEHGPAMDAVCDLMLGENGGSRPLVP